MKRLAMALEELHHDENDLAEELLQISDRHKVDHEVYHLARDLARWSQQHVRDLARVGEDYGLHLDPEPEDGTSVLARLRQKGSELLGHRSEPALVLLADLRRIHRKAAGVALDWEVLSQTAQALKDRELLALTHACLPQTRRQQKWADAKLKESAAQAMVS